MNRRRERERRREAAAERAAHEAAEQATENAEVWPAEPEERPRPTNRRRAIFFRLLAVSFPLLLLLGTNWVLYLCDVGHDTRMMVPDEREDGRAWRFNEDASRAYFDERELAGPDVQPFELPRPEDTYRIVVIGASTVEGFPYYTELAFPRQVGVFLEPQLPGRRVEVLNAGVVGINSFALIDLLPRVLPCEPDLVIVYAGHNEFYGPGGVGSTATISPALYSIQTGLRRWRIYQWLRNLTRAEKPHKTLVTALPKDLQIRRGSESFDQAETFYRQHLIAMAESAEKQEVPILFCSVASNLSDQSPVYSLARDGLSQAAKERLEALCAQAREQLDQEKFDAAMELVGQAAAIDADYALVAFRRAECLAGLGRADEAIEQYRRARDLDGCRFRAPGSFREIVKEVATDQERGQAYYLDIEQVLIDASQKAAPGHDLFFEHVHFNRDGNREVARAIARQIAKDVLEMTWDERLEPTADEVVRQIGLTTFDHIKALDYAVTITANPPFSRAPDALQHQDYLTKELFTYVGSLSDEDQVAWAQLDDELKSLDMINGLAAAMLARGDAEQALQLFFCAQQRRPWEITAYIGGAKCLVALGRGADALQCIEQALQLAPNDKDLLDIRDGLKLRFEPR